MFSRSPSWEWGGQAMLCTEGVLLLISGIWHTQSRSKWVGCSRVVFLRVLWKYYRHTFRHIWKFYPRWLDGSQTGTYAVEQCQDSAPNNRITFPQNHWWYCAWYLIFYPSIFCDGFQNNKVAHWNHGFFPFFHQVNTLPITMCCIQNTKRGIPTNVVHTSIVDLI